jgi:hypothetical protein
MNNDDQHTKQQSLLESLPFQQQKTKTHEKAQENDSTARPEFYTLKICR